MPLVEWANLFLDEVRDSDWSGRNQRRWYKMQRQLVNLEGETNE